MLDLLTTFALIHRVYFYIHSVKHTRIVVKDYPTIYWLI